MTPATNIPKLTASLVCVITCSACYDPSLIRVPETRQKQNYYYTPTSHNTPLLTSSDLRYPRENLTIGVFTKLNTGKKIVKATII